MSKPLTITPGEKFNWLKVIGPSDKKHKHGKQLVDCICTRPGCGKQTTVIASRLVNGLMRSCGCLKATGGVKITKRAAQAEHAAKKVIVDGGQEWYAPRQAAGYLGVDRGTLSRWIKSCPWLNGAGLVTRPLLDGYNQKHDYYLKEDLDCINEAKARQKPIADVTGMVYVETACQELGISMRTLRRRLRELGYRVQKITGKSRDQRARPRSYVPREFVDRCKERDKAGDGAADQSSDGNKITRVEAAAIMGVSLHVINNLVRDGKLHIIPEPCPGMHKVRCKGGYLRQGTFLSRREVLKVKAERAEKAEWSDKKTRREKAKMFLQQLLSAGDQFQKVIYDKATREGFTRDDMNTARFDLDVEVHKGNTKMEPFVWLLPVEKRLSAQPEQKEPTPSKTKRKGGRPRGSTDPQVQERIRAMQEAYAAGKFGTNKSEAGREFGFWPSHARAHLKGIVPTEQ